MTLQVGNPSTARAFVTSRLSTSTSSAAAKLLLFIAITTTAFAEKRVISDEEAHNAYDLAVQKMYSELKAPSTAHWSSFEQAVIKPALFGQVRVELAVDAQNSFGAMLRNTWSCTVSKPKKNGKYVVLCFTLR